MPRCLDPDLKETVKLLVLQGVKDQVIVEQTGIKALTLKTWLGRYGWRKIRANAKEMMTKYGVQSLTSEVAADLAQQSHALKSRLSNELSNQVTLLEDSPPKTVSELQMGRAKLAKDLIDAVNGLSIDGLGQTPITMLFLEKQESALEVESSVSHTPTDGVQEQGEVKPDIQEQH